MLVKHRMAPDPVTVTAETSFSDAFQLIREKEVHHLPVTDKKGKLIGIVTQKDLLHASPSSATALSVFEINYLLTKLEVKEVMTSPPITVPDETPDRRGGTHHGQERHRLPARLRGSDLVG